MDFIKLTLLLVFGPIAFVACDGPEDKVEKYFKRADKTYSEGELKKARVDLKNVLQIDQKHVGAHYLLALIEEKNQNWKAAFRHFEWVIDLDDSHLGAKVHLGQMYLLMDDLESAEDFVNAILSVNPDHTGGRTLKASLLFKKSKLDEAIREAKKVVAKEPQNEEATFLLAGFYRERKQYNHVISVLRKALEFHPDNISFLLRLAEIYYLKNEPQQVELILEKLTRLEPDEFNYRILLAKLYLAENRLDESEKILRQAVQELGDDDPENTLVLAEFLANFRGPDVAEKLLIEKIQSQPQEPDLQLGLGKLLEASGRLQDAEAIYEKTIEDDPNRPIRLKAMGRLADLAMQKDELERASNFVSAILDDNPKDEDALILKGRIALEKNNFQDAVIDFRSVLGERNESIEILKYLSFAHSLNNEKGLALDTISRAASIDKKNPATQLAYAKLLASTRDFDNALDRVDRILRFSPDDLQSMLLKFEIQMAAGNTDSAMRTMGNIQKLYPDDIAPYLGVGVLNLFNHNLSKAAQNFSYAAAAEPDSYLVQEKYVNALIRLNKQKEAERHLLSLLENNKNHRFAYHLLGLVHQSRKKFDKAETSYKKAIQIQRDWPLPYLQLGQLYGENKEFESGISLIQRGLKSIPGNIPLLEALAKVYLQAGKTDYAILTYEEILSKAPNEPEASNNLAMLLLQLKKSTANLKKALRLTKKFEDSENPYYRDTLGWVYFHYRQLNEALRIFSAVVVDAPRVAEFHYHLGLTHLEKGSLEHAEKHLTTALRLNQDFVGNGDIPGILDTIHDKKKLDLLIGQSSQIETE